jgi:hypothetical protein
VVSTCAAIQMAFAMLRYRFRSSNPFKPSFIGGAGSEFARRSKMRALMRGLSHEVTQAKGRIDASFRNRILTVDVSVHNLLRGMRRHLKKVRCC